MPGTVLVLGYKDKPGRQKLDITETSQECGRQEINKEMNHYVIAGYGNWEKKNSRDTGIEYDWRKGEG